MNPTRIMSRRALKRIIAKDAVLSWRGTFFEAAGTAMEDNDMILAIAALESSQSIGSLALSAEQIERVEA